MSLFSKRAPGDSNAELIPGRSTSLAGSVSVTADTALNMSSVWAALRLRADMISTFPLDVFRKVGSSQVEVPKPKFFVSPQGDSMTMREWVYSTQFDLDRVGNCYGIITAFDGGGHPKEVQLVAHQSVTVRLFKGVVTYLVGNKEYPATQIWHEKQFTVPGLVMGLNPVAHAAYTIGMYQSAEKFALEWFGNGGKIPGGHLRKTDKALTPEEAQTSKERFKATIAAHDVLVTGADWEYSTVNAEKSAVSFLETQGASDIDAARFFGVPADLIDVMTNSSSVTYANVTQRNLQFLITNLQPALTRREDAFSAMLAAPRFVKFNTSAILRMDPKTQADLFAILINAKIQTPDEARALLNYPPLTAAQKSEFPASPSTIEVPA